MMVTLSNPGLNLAIVGNPGPRRRKSRRSRRNTKRSNPMATLKQKRAWMKNLRKARAAQRKGKRRNPIRRKSRKARRSNPVTRSKRTGRFVKRYRTAAGRKRAATKARYKRKGTTKRLVGYKVVFRRKAGRKKKSSLKPFRGWSGRKGTVAFRRGRKTVATNPRRRKGRKSRRSYRRNPSIGAMGKQWVGGLTDLPRTAPELVTRFTLRKAAFASGGVVSALVLGSMAQRYTMPMLTSLPFVGGMLQGSMVHRVLGAAYAYTAGWGTAKVAGMVSKKITASDQTAIVTGAAVAALTEAIFPGFLGAQLAKVPVIGRYIGYASPVNGLGAYVAAPSYQGVGAYVAAPSYQGVGSYVSAPSYQGVGQYVEAPGYQSSSAAGDQVLSGMGDIMDYGRNDLAGMGSQMASFLDTPVY